MGPQHRETENIASTSTAGWGGPNTKKLTNQHARKVEPFNTK
ncbi:hypothetical protein [Staphylococcus marylandisciuri]|nr:hypothetical protein [Staphylococcus marylandisciuri]